ncbi:hypothetical protein, partial [Escherichia coli]|uniref:hypothetical protein n=1 Tax=Escherichia coli TaxID=562 RepID=UPI001BE3E062
MSGSVRPPSIAPPSGGVADPAETHETVTAEDGTRLFLRTMPARQSPETAGGSRMRAFFCDGILCDGFIWKYLW